MREYAKLQGVNFIPNGQIVSSQNAARRIQAAVRGFVVKTIIAKLKTTNSAAKEVKEAKRATKAAALAVVAARGKQAGGRDATGKHEGLGLLAEEGDSGAREGAGRADTKNGAEGPGSTPCTGRMSPSSIERGRLSRPISGHRPALHMKSCRIHIEGTPLQPTRTPTKRSLDPVATLEPTSALPLPTDMRPESSPLRAATRLAPPFLASPILVRHRPQEPSQQLPQPVPPAMNALTVSAGGARSRSPSRSPSPSAQRHEEEEEEEEDCGEGEKRSGGGDSPARSRSPLPTHRHQAPAHPKFGVDFLVSTSFGASPANVHTKSSPQQGAAATGTAVAGFESQPDPLLRYQQQQQQSNWRKQQMSAAAAASLPAGGGEVLGGCGAVFGRALPPPRRPPPASPRRAFSALYPQQQKGQSKGRTAASSNKVRVEVAAGGSGGGSGGGDGGGSRDKGAHAAFRVLRSSGDHRHNPYHAGDADDHDDHNGDDDACRAALFTEPHERVEALRTAVVASCRPDEERVDTGGGVGVGDDADDEVGRVPGVQLEMTQSSRGHFPPPLSSDHVRSGAASHDVSSRPRAAAAAAAAAAVNGGGGEKQQQQQRIPARPSSAPSFGARARKTVPSTTLAPPSSSASPSPRVGGTVSTTGFGIVDSYEASIGGGGGCGGSGSFAVKRLRERRALEASRRSEHATLLHLQFMEEQVGFTEGVQKAALDQKEQKQQRRQQRRRQRHQQERAEKKKKTLQQEEEAQQRPFPAPLAPTTLTQPPLASQRNSYTHASPLPTQSRVRQVPSTDSGCSGWSSGVSAVNSAPPTRRCYSAAQKKDKGHPLQGAKGSKSRNSAAGLPQG